MVFIVRRLDVAFLANAPRLPRNGTSTGFKSVGREKRASKDQRPPRRTRAEALTFRRISVADYQALDRKRAEARPRITILASNPPLEASPRLRDQPIRAGRCRARPW